MTPAGLILDFGEVLTGPQPPETLERMAALAGLPLDEFLTRYWRHRLDYDGGLTGADYWARVLDGVGRPDDATVRALIEADVRSWSRYREDVWRLAEEFRARGGRTAMLSNGVHEIVAHLRRSGRLDPAFDAVIVSCEVGRCKPDPEIYRIALERLGIPAASTLFVDDRAENIAAADALGLRTLTFEGDGSVPVLRRLLRL